MSARPGLRLRLFATAALVGALLVVPSAAGAATGAARTYVVVLDSSVAHPAAVADRHADLVGGRVSFVYRHALEGYALEVAVSQVDELRALPLVDHVERDRAFRAASKQSSPPWGLDRIDQRSLPLSGTYTYTNTGTGVTAYIIDTGIRFSHAQFGGAPYRATTQSTADRPTIATDTGPTSQGPWGAARTESRRGSGSLRCESSTVAVAGPRRE